MIAEGEILRRVEHLQQRRRGVAAEVHPQLIHLVQHEDRVVRAGAADALEDAPGQRADIGAPVPANLRFIAHRAERLPDECALHRARDGLPERGFAHARRPDEAQDRAFHIRLQLAHRQVIEDAVLHLFQVVMVFVEDLLSLRGYPADPPRISSRADRGSIRRRCATPYIPARRG